MNLSNAQRQIVEAPMDIAIQVLASAGSGKTRVLTERVRYILNNTKRDAVIALTFTNKAAEEMSSRLSDFDPDEDRVWIATIHSVAQRILEKYGHTIGLPSDLYIYDRDKDRMEVFMQSLREDGIDIDEYLSIADSKELKNRERNLQSYMDIFSKIKRELL
ncbi:ATP-dependent helicase, partial [Escherichia coli]|nr:ATP-dependent helicase [Escherichia coli]